MPDPRGWLGLIGIALLPTVAAALAWLRPDMADTVSQFVTVDLALPSLGPTAQDPAGLPWLGIVVTSYAAVAGAFLLRLAMGTVALHRRAAAHSNADGHTSADGHRDLVLSAGDTPPHALGWPRPCVVVPAALWDSLSEPERDMLLFHERAHLLRRDPETTFALLALQGLFWANPGLRLLVSGWHQAAEMRADQAVLHRHAPQAYARCLARIARSVGPPGRPLHPVPTISAKGDLAMRLHTILSRPALSRSMVRRTPIATLALGVGAGLAALASAAPGTSPAASADPVPIHRAPPVMPASCPGLMPDAELTLHADSVRTHEDGRIYMDGGTANVGEVVLRFDVDTNGVPRNIDVVRANADCFRAPSIAAVSQWRYTPGTPARDVRNMMRFVLTLDPDTDIKTALDAFSEDR